MSAKIRKPILRLKATGLILLSILQGFPSQALAIDITNSDNAAISLVLNKDIPLKDSGNLGRTIGTLTHGSRVTLAIPASVAATLNGKATLTNDELSELLSKIGGKNLTSGTGRNRRTSTFQPIAIDRSEQYSTVPAAVSAGSLNIKDLLKSDSLSLQPVEYNVANIATGPGVLTIRDAASRPAPAGANPRAETAATRTQAQATCIECDQARAAARTKPNTTNLNQLRAVGETAPRVPVTPARQASAARAPVARETQRPAARAPVEPVAATGSGSNYSNSAAVKKMIAFAMGRRHGRTTGKCYRYVKEALYASGLLPKNALANLVPAGHAAIDLARLGWKDLTKSRPSLLTDPKSAPVGSIVVYKDLQGGYGHVEIRTATGFVSDYYSAAGPYGRRFKVVGVMVPPNY